MRLNRYLSSCGLGSRRGCEALIRDGRVIVNGKTCNSLSTTIVDSDEVVVDGNKVKPEKGIVIVLHKPRGLVCSRRDERDRETVYALLPDKFHTLHHVGRLDKESEGLLLMTNRGEVSQRLMHPSQGVEKEYEVLIETRFDPEHLLKLTKGFHSEEGFIKAERAWMIGDYKVGMVLKQGLKRQIRLMLYFLGYEVKRLIRVRIGNLVIKGIPEGTWKELKDRDVEKLLLNPQAKDRPKLSKPKTASVRKNLATHRKNVARRAKSSPEGRTSAPPEKESSASSFPAPRRGSRSAPRERERERTSDEASPPPRRGKPPTERGDNSDNKSGGDRPAPRGDRPSKKSSGSTGKTFGGRRRPRG